MGTSDFNRESSFELWAQKQPEEQMERKEVETMREDQLFTETEGDRKGRGREWSFEKFFVVFVFKKKA